MPFQGQICFRWKCNHILAGTISRWDVEHVLRSPLVIVQLGAPCCQHATEPTWTPSSIFFAVFFGNGIRSSTNHVHCFFLIDASFLFGTFNHVSFLGYIFSTSIELEAFAQSTSDRNLKLNWPGSLFSTCFPQLIIEVIVAKK